jgi:hypothetical protein
MTTRHDAIERALATASETMHAKGEVQPMIIAHTTNTLMAFPGRHDDSSTTKDITAGMIEAEMRKSVTPAFMSS